MFRRKSGALSGASDAMSGMLPFMDQLAHDEKLRQRLLAAFSASAEAQKRARRQAGFAGVATLASDPVLRAQVAEAFAQLQKARGRFRTSGSSGNRLMANRRAAVSASSLQARGQGRAFV